MPPEPSLSSWTRFWHCPVRAERLAVTRIFFGVALLADQLGQYLPHFREFFGRESVAPAGIHDEWLLKTWHWSILIFNSDDLGVLYLVFGLWMAVTIAFILGWQTRLMNVLLWFLTMCWINRNPAILNGGDDTLQVGLFLLMLAPTGKALSLDRYFELRKLRLQGQWSPPPVSTTVAWPVRVLQIQLCAIYLSTGLAKLRGNEIFDGTWWDGTAIHYVLNYVTMSRWSYAQLPLPLWATAVLTYTSVWWEVLFTFLVLHRWTRKWALWFGVLFHVGIFLTIEVGWFSFYTLCLYGVWIPGEFFDWLWAKARPAIGKEPVRVPGSESQSPLQESVLAPVDRP